MARQKKEAIDLSRVHKFFYICVIRPSEIFVILFDGASIYSTEITLALIMNGVSMTKSLLTLLVVNDQEFTYPIGGQ